MQHPNNRGTRMRGWKVEGKKSVEIIQDFLELKDINTRIERAHQVPRKI